MRQGFVKVAAATPDIRVADVDYNTEQICRMMDEAAGEGAKIIVLPVIPAATYLPRRCCLTMQEKRSARLRRIRRIRTH